MSRQTQYIGLNGYANRYLKDVIKTELYLMTEGMFLEPIWGRIYYMPTPNGPNKEFYYKEVVQRMPWFGGPMIFTHLQEVLVKNSGQVIFGDYCFSWMYDPGLKTEFDYETGRFNI